MKITTFSVLLLVSSQANAILIDRGNGMIYDSDQNLTWLQDANYAFSSGYVFDNHKNEGGTSFDDILGDGRMGWEAANTWANELVHGGFDDWRLPGIIDIGNDGCNPSNNGTDCGYNVDTSGSELAYMFYVNLGNVGFFDTSGAFSGGCSLEFPGPGCLTNTSADGVSFQNLQPGRYWSSTEYNEPAEPFNYNAWIFNTANGSQDFNSKYSEDFAWAVRSGDVAVVPVPAAFWLFGTALIGLVGSGMRRTR